MDNYILQLQTLPAAHLTDEMIQKLPKDILRYSNMTRYRKELIKVGKYIKASTNQAFEVTRNTLKHWENEFNRWVNAGNRVPIPLGHERANKPEFNRGWVVGMSVEDDSLYGIMELFDSELARTTDVSICVEKEVIDGRGIKYSQPITHVALCVDPVIPGLKNFQTLSLSKGNKSMEFIKKLAQKLGLSKEDVKEDDILLALDKAGTPQNQDVIKPADVAVPAIVMLVGESREIKLSGLVKAGLITPAVKDAVVARYVTPAVVTLELAKGNDDSFDFIYKILSENRPVNLSEISGVQSLSLNNLSVEQPSSLKKVIDGKRKSAGLTN